MAKTYTQIYVQSVFSPKHKEYLIDQSWEDELQKYISGIIHNKEHKTIAINGMPDHVHIFIGMKPHQSLSSLIKDIKANSSKWINQKKFVKGKFSWQEGYGAFTYGHSQIDTVYKYIMNQKSHHIKISFKEEYLLFLKRFEIEFDNRYVFKFFE